jgi:hypothetical protein
LKNLRCVNSASSRCRLRIVISTMMVIVMIEGPQSRPTLFGVIQSNLISICSDQLLINVVVATKVASS